MYCIACRQTAVDKYSITEYIYESNPFRLIVRIFTENVEHF